MTMSVFSKRKKIDLNIFPSLLFSSQNILFFVLVVTLLPYILGIKPLDETTSVTNEGCNKIEIDGLCLEPSDVSVYESIKFLHAHLDDDQSGDIDLSESVDFLREELNYTKGLEKRQQAFHHNDDSHISVQELWRIWLSNEVHNWTVGQTVGWLCVSVELSQYAELFYENAINGSMLPRLATNNEQFLTRILGIKSATHRSKITIKAMDIVLFGPPKDSGSRMKDVFIASLLCFIAILSYKFVSMSRHNNKIISKMDQEMESLQEELKKFYEDKAQHDDAYQMIPPCANYDELLENDQNDDLIGFGESVSVYRDEDLMSDFTVHLDVPTKNELQMWLQLGYERERATLHHKIKMMEKQIAGAKESCQKLKINKNFFGALSFMHGKLESKGLPVIEARASFEEIQQIDKETKLRWQSIEKILNFDIVKNKGLLQLEFILEPELNRYSAASNSTVGDPLEEKRNPHSLSSSHRFAASSSSPPSDSGHSSLRGLKRPGNVPSSIQQSHTVGSDLSSISIADRDFVASAGISRSASYETPARKVSSDNGEMSVPQENSVNHDSSNDETDSCNFTIGAHNAIQICDTTSLPGKSSTVMLLARNSPKSTAKTDKSSIRSIENSNSHRQFSDKHMAVGKSSSEPSLDNSNTEKTAPFSTKKGGGSSKSKNIFSVFRSKSDKNKK